MILKLIYLIAVVLATVVPSQHALHMFQQNRYECGRYLVWIEDSMEGGVKRALLPALVIVAVAFACMRLDTQWILMICLLISVFLAVILFLRERKAKYIKPLVYTGRVKRQIFVLGLLYLILQMVLLAYFRRLNLWLMLALSYFGPWVLIFPMAWITAPVENAVKKWYVHDAKRILDEHEDLVKIGITGSYGKTSTKNVMASILSEQFNALMTPASFNTPMGITRTIREYLKPIHKVFICEMGADHVGDITTLMEFVHPSIGVVTSIGPQHLMTFGSQEKITHEKMQMIEMLPRDGFGVLNYDNEFIRNYRVQFPVHTVSYGIRCEEVDYRAVDIQYSEHGSTFTLLHDGQRIPFETKLLGELNILNILSAICVSRYLNVPWETIQRGVQQMHQVEHRLEQKVINGRRFIDDAFNSNPSGSAMALEVLRGMSGRRFIITPGMIDLGKEQNALNKEFGRKMKGCADTVLLVGANQTRPIFQGLQESGFDMNQVFVVDRVKEAFEYVYAHTTGEDVILLENDLPDAFNK